MLLDAAAAAGDPDVENHRPACTASPCRPPTQKQCRYFLGHEWPLVDPEADI